MLRVPTVVAPSSIEGVGLFAAEPITAGTVIWEFTEGVDWRIPVMDFERFPEPYRSWLLRYVYREPTGCYVLCGDNGKFMNHSFEPNCDDVDGPYTVAKRDIAEGEELTCDYRLFDLDSVEGEELAAYR
ncbi:MAG: SET domain-containing protein-lysine N-methyltransferase [Thioalkalivibrio sp.]|nr:SET domain-containing protein-lysine N-methyltransferase [Thioalkalivibrio sp.]